jgi:hypothetical protein
MCSNVAYKDFKYISDYYDWECTIQYEEAIYINNYNIYYIPHELDSVNHDLYKGLLIELDFEWNIKKLR